ncbi:ribbon-helix-helix protein, CopG family [Myceligenerans sp. TRM 65318]|uniref:Ribbon-helix-helix protein, CopG family n=2 Tax=Myceligenerans pegani TaxID=2776917 RepID=A0ABR9MTX8_9MICO|nr:ribbon-helix-helix protein, CopG family [Myceligenerans sp. TRM 65318]MBE3017098.1 ribbon-helix-helix protein, CopG family [Myceligenerans sp. TRM 65318]
MAMTLRLTEAEDKALADTAAQLGISKHEAARQAIHDLVEATRTPTTTDWLAAAEYVGKRDRELLDRLAR